MKLFFSYINSVRLGEDLGLLFFNFTKTLENIHIFDVMGLWRSRTGLVLEPNWFANRGWGSWTVLKIKAILLTSRLKAFLVSINI